MDSLPSIHNTLAKLCVMDGMGCKSWQNVTTPLNDDPEPRRPPVQGDRSRPRGRGGLLRERAQGAVGRHGHQHDEDPLLSPDPRCEIDFMNHDFMTM